MAHDGIFGTQLHDSMKMFSRRTYLLLSHRDPDEVVEGFEVFGVSGDIARPEVESHQRHWLRKRLLGEEGGMALSSARLAVARTFTMAGWWAPASDIDNHTAARGAALDPSHLRIDT